MLLQVLIILAVIAVAVGNAALVILAHRRDESNHLLTDAPYIPWTPWVHSEESESRAGYQSFIVIESIHARRQLTGETTEER